MAMSACLLVYIKIEQRWRTTIITLMAFRIIISLSEKRASASAELDVAIVERMQKFVPAF